MGRGYPADSVVNMYQDDTPQTVYDEMVKLENEIELIGRGIRALGVAESNAISDYEKKKNDLLVTMFAEEADGTVKKRTEQQRAALYRKMYSDERLAANLAKLNLKSERDLLDALKAKLQSIQSRKGILLSEIERSGRVT